MIVSRRKKKPLSKHRNHNKRVNAIAEAPSATAESQTRLSTTRDPTAALVAASVVALPVLEAEAVGWADPVCEDVMMRDEDEEGGAEGRAEGGAEDGVEELEGVEEEDTVLLPLPAPVPGAGAATAVEGSASAPVPHGIASFVPGWVGLAGGVVAPVEEAMVKRVVQVLRSMWGEVNW